MLSDSEHSSDASSSSEDVPLRLSITDKFEPSSVGLNNGDKGDLLTARHDQIMKEFE
jgi:hypothetical protein